MRPSQSSSIPRHNHATTTTLDHHHHHHQQSPHGHLHTPSCHRCIILLLSLWTIAFLYLHHQTLQHHLSSSPRRRSPQLLKKRQYDKQKNYPPTTKNDDDDDKNTIINSSRQQSSPLIHRQNLHKNLSHSLELAKRRLISDYGPTIYDNLFAPTALRTLLSSSNTTHHRFVRRLRLVFLENNVVFLDGDDDDDDDEVTNEKKRQRRRPFVWVTAGHSVAAGHGNLMNQTYTAILQDFVFDAFASVGIPFVAHNRGIGGASSGPEVAMCMTTLFGPDVDILLWDFNMADRTKFHKIHHWANRAGRLLSRPLLVALAEGTVHRRRYFQSWEERGMGYVNVESRLLRSLVKEVVQVVEGGEVPMGIRNLVCDGVFEAVNLSPCREEKWDTERFCGGEEVKGQVTWHPGWKSHMLHGRLFGMYLLELLDEALSPLLRPNTNPTTTATNNNTTAPSLTRSYLQHLYHLEHLDSLQFRNDPDTYDYRSSSDDDDLVLKRNLARLANKTSICYAALLPSHARASGIIDAKPRHRRELTNVSSSHHSDNTIPLVHDDDDNNDDHCGNDDNPIPLRFDHADYFHVTYGNDDAVITLPTKNQIQAYDIKTTTDDDDGVVVVMANIVLCLRDPSLSRQHQKDDDDYDPLDVTELLNEGGGGASPKKRRGFSSLESLVASDKTSLPVTIAVNNATVSKYRRWEDRCVILENKEGGMDWVYDDETRLRMAFKVEEEDRSLELSSIVVFL